MPKPIPLELGKRSMDSTSLNFFLIHYTFPILNSHDLKAQVWSMLRRKSKNTLNIMLCTKLIDLPNLPLSIKIINSNETLWIECLAKAKFVFIFSRDSLKMSWNINLILTLQKHVIWKCWKKKLWVYNLNLISSSLSSTLENKNNKRILLILRPKGSRLLV